MKVNILDRGYTQKSLFFYQNKYDKNVRFCRKKLFFMII